MNLYNPISVIKQHNMGNLAVFLVTGADIIAIQSFVEREKDPVLQASVIEISLDLLHWLSPVQFLTLMSIFPNSWGTIYLVVF